jgi:hypothetical protein
VKLHLAAAILSVSLSGIAGAQSVKPGDSASSKPAPPAIDFSGIIFANYQYRGEDAAESANRFDLERAYLNFRMPAGDRANIRITTDVFQQTGAGSDAYYRGWSIRAKYAFIQYNYLAGTEWKAYARLGLLQTVFIEHDESFWPRWLGISPTERAGFFSSADAGIANGISLPRGLGEIYSTVTNGPGYTSREIDRFKDFATRVTVRPFAANKESPFRGVALSAWGYRGSLASKFVAGGPGQIGSIGSALKRDRWGIHAASASPRMTIAAQFASRIDEGEAGLNTNAAPRVVIDSTGTLMSAYGMIRPLPSASARPHPLSVVLRFDRVTTNDESDDAYDFVVAGLIWDFSSRLSASLDYQEATPREGTPVVPTRTWFAHFVARF